MGIRNLNKFDPYLMLFVDFCHMYNKAALTKKKKCRLFENIFI